ncbi:MAG: flagellar hook-associated protein 3 [Firmicutes bacterium HGW-Firmicutes-2]|nr:MAG: flagellar hook-associated protein 3 [Firmicutes bacterium HGW-Firmicutes-2]
MRITNSMMTNNVLININRNRETLSLYETQMATGKKIQKPSDNPIVAIRALKFRNNVNEIKQYKTNAEDAISWAGVTEQSVTNVTEILKRVRDLSVQATSDILNIDNRKNVVTEIEQLMEQFMNEGNTTYAGRHVFSGYKTNMPLVFTETSGDTYELTQGFKATDVEKTKRVVDNEIIDVHRIRLGYTNISNPDTTTLIPPFTTVNTLNASDPGAMTPAIGEVNFIQDTGELIFHPDDVASIPNPLDFTYEKTGFDKGDLMPEHYFVGQNLTTGTVFNVNDEKMLYQISYSQQMSINTMGYDVIGIDLVRDIEELINATKSITADGTLTSALQEDLLGDVFNKLIGKMDKHIGKLLNTRAEIGGKINRLELTINRLSEDNLNFTDLLSKNEDVDYAEVIMKMAAQEMVYNASLAASAKIIQPTLLDFIR